jgi:hypothetical protein
LSSIKPPFTPQQKPDVTARILREHGVDPEKHVAVLGVRGYYKQSMGDPTKNDRKLYDDAIFINSPRLHLSFNANVDPGAFRKGYGKAESTKGIANLKAGNWKYRLGLHKGDYLAGVQAAQVVVIRDGEPDYEDAGWFGINIHCGGITKVSSTGCQTITPDQWKKFINTLSAELGHYKQSTFNYVLVEV